MPRGLPALGVELPGVLAGGVGGRGQPTVTGAPQPPVGLDWHRLWMSVGARYEQRIVSLRAQGEQALRQELLFCLLSGHAVPYELALSAAAVVGDLEPFHPRWATNGLEERLRAELGRPQFEPRRGDGALRRYRFPNRKATLLARACEWVQSQGSLWARLQELGCELERRELLCECPGIGMKTASFLLRNCGLAEGLAVLDVHVLRLMGLAGRLADASLPRDYEHVEGQYLAWCRELEASPAAFDLLLWELGRGVLSAR